MGILWKNDITELGKELNSEILNSYLKDLKFSQNLISEQNQIDELAIQKIERGIERERQKNSLSFKLLKFIFKFITNKNLYLLFEIFFYVIPC